MKKAIASALLIAAASTTLSACGLRPLYSGGTSGVIPTQLGNVQIEPIAGQSGMAWSATRYVISLEAFEGQESKYRLIIELDDKIAGFGVRSDDRITRERRTLRARYQLVRLSDSAVVLDATAGSDAGIDVVSSEYATVAAEDTALENLSTRIAQQIVTRLSLFAREQADNPAS